MSHLNKQLRLALGAVFLSATASALAVTSQSSSKPEMVYPVSVVVSCENSSGFNYKGWALSTDQSIPGLLGANGVPEFNTELVSYMYWYATHKGSLSDFTCTSSTFTDSKGLIPIRFTNIVISQANHSVTATATATIAGQTSSSTQTATVNPAKPVYAPKNLNGSLSLCEKYPSYSLADKAWSAGHATPLECLAMSH